MDEETARKLIESLAEALEANAAAINRYCDIKDEERRQAYMHARYGGI